MISHSRLRLSSQRVTGPSLVRATFMSAPKIPVAMGFPRVVERDLQKVS